MVEPTVSPLLLKTETEINTGSKPKIDAYVKAAQQEKADAHRNIATTKESIYENFPFVGTLLKKTGDHFRLKEEYYINAPGSVEEVEDVFGTGDYQLRIPLENGELHSIHFSIKKDDQEAFQKTPATSVKEENLEIELKEKTQRIARLEGTKGEIITELDTAYRKIRELRDEVTQAEINAKKLFDEERKEFKDEIREIQRKLDETKEEKERLDRKNHELKLEAKFADRDSGFDWEGMVERAMESETLAGIFSAVVNKAKQAPNTQTGMHALPRPNPEQPLEQPINDIEEPEPMQTATHQAGQALAQQVVNAIYNKGIEQITAQNPQFETVAPFVNQQIEMYTNQGFEFPAENWINIAKELVKFSVQHNVEPKRLAGVIEPLVSNIPIAVKTLKTSPVKMAVTMLKNVFDLTLNAQETEVLVDVLKIFKTKLKGE